LHLFLFKYFFCIFFIVSCASYTDNLDDLYVDYLRGDYTSALNHLEKSGLSGESKNKFLYLCEKSILLDRLEKREQSRQLLIAAGRLWEKLYTESITRNLASWIINDSMTEYSGEDYEKSHIPMMTLLSFLEDGNFKNALISARKIHSVLHAIINGYGDLKNTYQQDAFAFYLAGIIYEKLGQVDDALIDYRKSLKIYENEYFHYGVFPPPSLIKIMYRLAKFKNRKNLIYKLEKHYPQVVQKTLKANKSSEILVIYEVGRIAHKISKEFHFLLKDRYIRFSFPVIARSKHLPIHKTGINLAGHWYSAELAQDLTAIAYQSLEDRRFRLLAKSATRLLLKDRLAQKAEKNFGQLAGVFVNALGAIIETADTRSWSLLPEAFYITHLWLSPGKYPLSIFINGRLISLKEVLLLPGEKYIYRIKEKF